MTCTFTSARVLIKMENAGICIVHLRKKGTSRVDIVNMTVRVGSMEKTTTGAKLIALLGDTAGW